MEELGPDLAFEISTGQGGHVLVVVSGELDIASVDRLEDAVAPVIGTHPDRLVVDVAGLRFADSSAIALWVRWATVVGEIELRHCSPLLQRVIESMGLDETLRLAA